jgi:hypothetical protein
MYMYIYDYIYILLNDVRISSPLPSLTGKFRVNFGRNWKRAPEDFSGGCVMIKRTARGFAEVGNEKIIETAARVERLNFTQG